ncbi:MAG: discoidin domain-containing protein, partial [Phycisphaerales bacterium]
FFSAGVTASCTTVEQFAGAPAGRGEVTSSSPNGLAMGMGRLVFALAPGAEVVAFAIAPQGTWTEAEAEAWLDSPQSADARTAGVMLRAVQDRWQERAAASVRIDLGDDPLAQRILKTVTTQLDAITVNADGPAVQPGSRCYERSWARDGAMTSVTMLAFGRPDAAKRWIEWYFSKQFESGKVPCVVDVRGPDPVDEHDSTGQLIYALAEYHRFTGDIELVRRVYPGVVKGVAYMESLRARRLTAEFGPDGPARQEPGKPKVPAVAFRGILPESISHEGYSAKPMHSYWDNFFALRGLKDAAHLAGVMGDKAGAERYATLVRSFRASVLESIERAQAAHGIDYIPGCVELGDFDATSTAAAVSPCAEQVFLPRAALRTTFDKWWTFFTARRNGRLAWGDYTPYELRTVGVMVELGERERAIEMLRWYFEHQRPQGWNHWAEVVTSDPRQPRFIGDMPHTWVGSDYLRSVRTMLAYERDDAEGETLVLLGGIPGEWTEGRGVSATALPTHVGPITLSARRSGPGRVVVRITGAGPLREGARLEVVDPLGTKDSPKARRITIDGEAVEPAASVLVRRLPATIEFDHGQ